MTAFELLALVVTLTAVIGFANERWLRLPTVIGVMVGGLVTSVAILGLGKAGLLGGGDVGFAASLLEQIHFDDLLMHGLLGALLFAGALEVDLGELLDQRWMILTLATAGVIASTFAVGFGAWLLLGGLGLEVPLIYALLFGALISPTDPIAVLALLRRAGAPKRLETLISGESLFNDGVGVVVFTILIGLIGAGAATHGAESGVSALHVLELFAVEAVGGIVFGLVVGYLAYLMLHSIDAAGVEILVTLALVTGGYALALRLHTSGPLAMVVAGLFIGNRGRRLAMSERTRERLDVFWVVVDEVLNAVLFVLIGLEILVLDFGWSYLFAGLLAIPLVLGVRLVTVGSILTLYRLKGSYQRHTIRLMTWAGLRGGIAIALALSVPPSETRDLLLVMTYAVVLFSILVQGLTVEPLARRAVRARREQAAPGA